MKPFQFRHFSIQQSNAAMKVGTDAMLLGALCDFEKAASVLDIGTGTGVLSLMVAQRFAPARITAVELDEQAFLDATANFSTHPFTSQIEAIRADIRKFESSELFDGIITNPPFFENSSQSAVAERNLARHTGELAFSDLFAASARLLAPQGKLWMILPWEVVEQITETALASELHLHSCIRIEGKPGKAVRAVMELGKLIQPLITSTFTVRNADGSYTKAYIELTREFHGVELK